jgi:CheY-specific phosphatase CheX
MKPNEILSSNPPDKVDDNVRDVLDELVNVIGGNMKCVMTTAARLSMPTVIEGGDEDVRVFGSKARERCTFDSSQGNFWVTILGAG